MRSFRRMLALVMLVVLYNGMAQYDLKKTKKAFYLLNQNKIFTQQSMTNFYSRKYKLFPVNAQQNIYSAAGEILENLDSVSTLLPREKNLLADFEKLKNLTEIFVSQLSNRNTNLKDLHKSKNRVLKKLDLMLETLVMYTDFDESFLEQIQKLVNVNQNLQVAMQEYIRQYDEGSVDTKNIISMLKDAGKDMKSIRDYYAKDKKLAQILRHIHQDIQLFHQGIKNGYAPKIMVASLNKSNRKILEAYSILTQKQQP